MSTVEEDRTDGDETLSNAPPSETNLPPGSYDAHWWSGRDWPEFPFEYNRKDDQFRTPYNFMKLLYDSGRVQKDLLFTQLEMLERHAIGDSKVAPGNKGRPKDALPVTRLDLPGWYPTELAYRAMAVWRGILTIAIDQRNRDPLLQYLNTQKFDKPVAAAAQYPKSVRDLIVSNSNLLNQDRVGLKTWIGDNVKIDGGKAHIGAFPDIKVGLDKRVTTKQGGGCGPFSIEAAFILGTQVAGVNFRHAAKKIKDSGRIEGWWIGVLMPGGSKDNVEFLREQRKEARIYGKYLRSNGNGQHDVDAGIYIAIDLDPTLDAEDDRHNVFVFIVHAIDAYSVIGVAKNADLRAVDITRFDPPKVKDGKVAVEELSESLSEEASMNAADSRQVAHAHVGILKRKDFITWVHKETRDPRELFPVYTQISMLHLYVHTEDWDLGPKEKLGDWPRKSWLSKMPSK